MDLVAKNFVLSQLDLKTIRLVCKDWLQLVDTAWQDYLSYARQRSNIYSISPDDMIYIHNRYYVKNPDWKPIRDYIYHPETGKYKCTEPKLYCGYCFYILIGRCNCKNIIKGEHNENYEVCSEESICFRLEEFISEGDLVQIRRYSGSYAGKKILTLINGEISEYKESFFPLEKYNINYFQPFGKEWSEIVKRPLGYFVEYEKGFPAGLLCDEEFDHDRQCCSFKCA
jgi:hypothetical protein